MKRVTTAFSHHPVRSVLLLGLVIFGAMQLVPYRFDNPPVLAEPAWDSPRTRSLAVAACFDCHSNQTKSHWYTQVAPLSWWTANHVREGRSALNFSEWTGRGSEENPASAVAEGSMPPSYYTWFGENSAANLSPADRQALIDGLRATIGSSGAGDR